MLDKGKGKVLEDSAAGHMNGGAGAWSGIRLTHPETQNINSFCRSQLPFSGAIRGRLSLSPYIRGYLGKIFLGK